VWKIQLAAAVFCLAVGCTPARETSGPEAADVAPVPAKLMTWDDLSALLRPVASQTVRWGEGGDRYR